MKDKILATIIVVAVAIGAFIISTLMGNQHKHKLSLNNLEVQSDTLQKRIESLEAKVETLEKNTHNHPPSSTDNQQSSNPYLPRNPSPSKEPSNPYLPRNPSPPKEPSDPYLSANDSRNYLSRQGYEIRRNGDEYHLIKGASRIMVSNISGIVMLPDGTLIKTDASGLRISPK